jgi:predicted phosphodiesterase
MRALILADINELHWYHGSGHADLILAVGDTADSLILEAADAHGASRIFAVKGNHDATTTFPRTSPTCIGHESNSAV